MALPRYGSRGNMLYDPQSTYGWDKDWQYLAGLVGQDQAQNQPMSYYTRLLGQQGKAGFDTRSTVSRGLFGRLTDAYGAAQLTNPELTWMNFMGGVDIDRLLSQMSPQERGENRSNFAPMDVRWLPRP